MILISVLPLQGLMGWVTANYLLNKFGDHVTKDTVFHATWGGVDKRKSLGALDWGGASSQITVQVMFCRCLKVIVIEAETLKLTDDVT